MHFISLLLHGQLLVLWPCHPVVAMALYWHFHTNTTYYWSLGGAPSLGSPWGVACYLYLMQRYALIGKHNELGHIGTDANTMQLMTG